MTALQNQIIEKISKTFDANLLEQIDALLENKESEYTFTQFEHSILNDNKEAYNKGEYLTSEEMALKVEEWIKK